MKLILWDVESSPNTAYTFQTYKAFIQPAQIITPSRIMCWSAKQYGSKTIAYADERAGHKKMIQELHAYLSDADALISYNGTSFDTKMLNAEFVQYGMKPLPPFKQIDLYRVVKKNFKLPSYKLEYVAHALGIGEKVKHQGFHLWRGCLEGDEKAWKTMTKYNKQDTQLLEALYERLLPWISQHPSRSLENEERCCTNCGSDKLQRRGKARTKVATYDRFACTACGTWQRGRISEVAPENRQNIMVAL